MLELFDRIAISPKYPLFPLFGCIKSENTHRTFFIFQQPFNNYTYIINLYLKLVQAFSNLGNVENYYSYKKALFKNKDKLNKNELYFHYSKLIAYCSLQKDKTGNYEFQKEIAVTAISFCYRNPLFFAISCFRIDYNFLEKYSY